MKSEVCSGQGSRKESRKGKWRKLERKEKKQKTEEEGGMAEGEGHDQRK
jgi:hypothetical protein